MDANNLLMSGGGISAKFLTVDASVTGTICAEPEVRQQTDVKSGEAKFYDDGKPMYQVVAQLQTTQRDPEQADDDGIRTVWIKGKMQTAVRDAVKRAGAAGLAIGGTLTITYIGDGERKNRAMDPPKLYEAEYVPPISDANALLTTGTTVTDSMRAASHDDTPPPGVSATVWASLTPEQRTAVAATTPPF